VSVRGPPPWPACLVCGQAAAALLRRHSLLRPPLPLAGAIGGPIGGPWRPTEKGRLAPFVWAVGPNGVEVLVWLIPVLSATLKDKSHQLITNFTCTEGLALGLEVTDWPKNINGKEIGLRIAGRTQSGWDFAHDVQFAAGRVWSSTSTHAQIKRLTFREATHAEAQATLDAQAALKPR